MLAVLRSIAMMLLAPPTVLLFWAHFVRPSFAESELLAVVFAGAAGLVGAITAPWAGNAKPIVAGTYVVLCFMALPFASLLAVCSTGLCL
jgi:hypothetical protein